jgi:hypothetical protein
MQCFWVPEISSSKQKIETSLLSIKKKCDEENSDEKNPCSTNVIFPLEFPRNKIGNSLSSFEGCKKVVLEPYDLSLQFPPKRVKKTLNFLKPF